MLFPLDFFLISAIFGKVFLFLVKEQKTNACPFSAACEVPRASATTHPEEGRVERQKGSGSFRLSSALELTNPRDTPALEFSLYKTVQLLLVGSLLFADKSILVDLNENKHNHDTNNI